MCQWNKPCFAKNNLESTPLCYKSFFRKLSLCIGVPVIIRNNDATELCIPKGRKGHVAGWQASRGIHGQLVLDTLFIKLDKPPKIVKIDGLPENVVPITRGSKNIECTFQVTWKNTSTEVKYGYCLISLWLTIHHRKDQTTNPVDWAIAEVTNHIIPPCQEVQLQVELSLCSHFPLDSSHVELQDIWDRNFVNLRYWMRSPSSDMKVNFLIISKANLETH